MCGIAGILVRPSAAVCGRQMDAIEAITATLHHRGPDGGGFWSDRTAGVAFGHRRLAIVDLSEAGHQPMLSQGGRLVTTYNGEIYNAAELRRNLEARGHCFRGHSDTEVMLECVAAFGLEPTLKRAAGMFALAVWDRAERVLHLARDCIGKKPLYVAIVEGALVFASELRAIAAFPGFERRIDHAALALLMRQGWVPDDHCIYEGVFKLPPGTVLSVRPDDLATCSAADLSRRARQWWSLAEVAMAGERDVRSRTAAELTTELEAVLSVAVSERMVADVPLGAFLSGGIDSSVVVALMQAHARAPVRTFTVGFAETDFDEARDAARIAAHLGTDHTEFRVSAAEARAVIPNLPNVWDEPFADESQIPTLLVASLARRSVTVALSGDGGDECFGGYTRHVMSARLGMLLRVPAPLRAVAGVALGLAARGRDGGHMRKLARVLDARTEAALYGQLLSSGRQSFARPPARAMVDTAPPLGDIAARFMARDMATYLPGDILVKLDRASMAVSLEARCPLLDRRVVAFAWGVPTAFKLRDGKGKWLLRQVLARHVPAGLFERPKHGFNVPLGSWLRGPLRDWAGDMLAEPQMRQDGLLDAARVRACWRDHLVGRHDRSAELWTVLMLQAWLHGTPERHATVRVQAPLPPGFSHAPREVRAAALLTGAG